MPRGIPFKRDIRELIEFHFRYSKSPENFFQLLFMSNSDKASLEYISKLCCHFLSSSSFSSTYSSGPHPRRKTREKMRRLDWRSVNEIMDLRESDIEINFKSLTRRFNFAWFGESVENYVCLTTVRRLVIARLRWSRKKLERRHRDANPLAQLRYMQAMGSRDPFHFKDIDEMNIAPADFTKRYGYAPEGDDAVKTQLVIGTRSFCTIAMLGFAGIEAFDWEENATFDGDKFSHFITNKCLPVLVPGDIGILDNASIHTTEAARDAMDLAFNADWTLCSAYSPYLKPIERVFALIKQYIRENEEEALLEPAIWINRAFQRYSIDGSHGHVVSNF